MSGRLPETRRQMLRAGYELMSKEKFSTCDGCGEFIEWWKTTNKKNMPFNVAEQDEPAVPHWATCPKAKDFKKKPAVAPQEPLQRAAAPTAAGNRLIYAEREVSSLQKRYGARVIVMLLDDGHIAAWRKGVPAEDVAHELITEANKIRRAIAQEVKC